MSNAIILYKNVFIDGTGNPAATSVESGFDALNIADLKGYTYWGADGHTLPQYITVDYGSNVSADALGIFSHNLGTLGLSLSVEVSDDDPEGSSGVAITEALAPFTPSDDKAILKTFTEQTGRWWRLKIDGALDSADDNPFIGVLSIGLKMLFPNAQQSKIRVRDERQRNEVTRSGTGQHLGSVQKYIEQKPVAKIPLLTNTWFDANFLPFWDEYSSLAKPFFFAPDIDAEPGLVHWVLFTGNYKMVQEQSVGGLIDMLVLNMEAIKE